MFDVKTRKGPRVTYDIYTTSALTPPTRAPFFSWPPSEHASSCVCVFCVFCSPKWNFDGSSTNQAPGDDSEVIIYPQAIYPDPFRGGDNIMVLCDCYKPDGTPIDNNTRMDCAEIMAKVRQGIQYPVYFSR